MFGLGHLLSKHKTTRQARNVPPGYACGGVYTLQSQVQAPFHANTLDVGNCFIILINLDVTFSAASPTHPPLLYMGWRQM